MRYLVSNIPLSLDCFAAQGQGLLHSELAKALGVRRGDLLKIQLLKRSVDARKRSSVHFVANMEIEVADGVKPRPARGIALRPWEEPEPFSIPYCAKGSALPRPIVVGAGPAGLFCALFLAKAGLQPLVVERGQAVEQRKREVATFFAGGPLDPNSNVQFGEGGAGTFSDGKLNTGTKSPHIRHVLETFVQAGAPPEILWQAKPHIGTDYLVTVVANLRAAILEAGGEVSFGTCLTDLAFDGGGRVRSVVLEDEGESCATEEAGAVVLACGHSARDTFSLLKRRGVAMERKPFSVGVRIEHPQEWLDKMQHGASAGHPALGAADYKLAVHNSDGRGVYTFCMCPGGMVVAAASEAGGLCVNGMSDYSRDGRNCNSALLVSVAPGDLPGADVLAGVELQRFIERAAFALGGGNYVAPAQTVADFLAGAVGDPSTWVQPTYPRGVAWKNLAECLPPFVVGALREALPALDRKLPGFANGQAVFTGVETRSSSPVRLVRGDDLCAVGHPGLYPAGEGAGYAGGIMSAACDGLRVAEAVAARYV